MFPYLLIIIINFQAVVIEFPDAGSCIEAKSNFMSKVNLTLKPAAMCFEKIGGEKKET
jgi:hypothetical protein